MPEGKKPAEDLYSAKTHLHQPVPEVSTVNATALPADAPEGALPSEVRPEIVTWEKLCEAITASGKAYNLSLIHISSAMVLPKARSCSSSSCCTCFPSFSCVVSFSR